MSPRTAFLTAALCALAACGAPTAPRQSQTAASVPFSVAPPNAPSGPVVDAFAASVLDSYQPLTIANKREYCGYIFVDARGNLQSTTGSQGRFASCTMPAPRVGQGIIASFHTHPFGRGFTNELPSTIDLISDFDYGIDGYVATPSGRLWLVDFQTRSTRQLCGPGCLTSDPAYVPPARDMFRQSYTLDELRRRPPPL